MWSTIIALALCLNITLAQWGTFYSFSDGRIYMRLKNNDMVALNFSITGFSDLEKYSTHSLSEINIQTNQIINTLSLPPVNSSVFLYGSELYAFTASSQDSDFDVCGDGVFQLLKYYSDEDSWSSASDNMTFSDVNDVSFYSDSSYLVTDDYSTIYIYGGYCSSTGEITDRMLSFNMETKSFSNITTSTKPQAFHGAASLWAPNPQTLLVIGGKASTGWLSMYQLATWNFQSGWLFQLAAQNGSATISSRINPLTLPVFSPLSDNSSGTFDNDYKTKDVLMVGGEISGDSQSSGWSKLSLLSNKWSWSEIDTDLDLSQVMGAAAVFDTLVVVNSTGSLKRDDQTTYLISLYDISNQLQAISDLKSNTPVPAQNSSSSGTSTTTKIVVGTFVPLAALSMVAAIGVYFWKRKSSNDQHSELQTVDYPLGHFRTALNQSYDPLRPNHLNFYNHSNETGSTLEVGSIDSWVRKRQEYDAKRFRTLKRHSYLASNETLNGHLIDRSEQPEIDDDDDSCDLAEQEMTQVSSKPMLPRVQQLRKSFSYSNTPPHLPHLKKLTRLDPGYIDLGDLPLTEDSIEEPDSCDENMDVQVLVSSKRKSVLRIMNPDTALEDGTEEMRQRMPSK